jgi:ADP-ribosylglycohydrolase
VSDRLDRAQGALLGLAGGDAAGYPAMYHRQIAVPARRRLLWLRALEADSELVNRFPLPYSQSEPLETMAFGPTDDAEQAALAAQVLLDLGNDPTTDELFDGWFRRVDPQRDALWGSIADRSAIKNARLGLRAPTTGNDNPHHYDDSSVARSVPVGIRWSGDPERAACVARRLASITNADVGVDGAAAFAAAIATIVGGGDIPQALEAARREIGEDSWISRKWGVAEAVLAAEGSVLAAIPRFHDEVANLEYAYGNVVAETLPVALIIARESAGFGEALGLAALLPKQADTMPAMVGALVGASAGARSLPGTWCAAVEELRGVCVPSTKGVRLRDLASQLLERGTATRIALGATRTAGEDRAVATATRFDQAMHAEAEEAS